jgi:hypothetical protein
MPLASLTHRPPVSRKEATQGRSQRLQVSGKLLTACQELVWGGATRAQAAERAGMSEHGLYAALKKSHVRVWLRDELNSRRLSAEARALHQLEEIMESSTNDAARVAAAKEIRQGADKQEHGQVGVASVPGLVIQIINNNGDPKHTMDGDDAHVIGRDDARSDP